MNKNLHSYNNTGVDSKENYKLILRELQFNLNTPYKELAYDIEKDLREGSDYRLDSYNFDKDFNVEVRINKFVNDDLLIYFLVINSWFYRDMDEEEAEYSHVLSHHIDKDKHLIFTVAKAIEFIKELKDKYYYCKFTDHLMDRKTFNKNLKIRLQRNMLCNRENHECVVCYDPTSEYLKCPQCKKQLCRVCEFKLIDYKCPNCRRKFIFDDEDDEDENI